MKEQTYIKAGVLLAFMLAVLAGFIYLYKQSTTTDVGRQEHLLGSIYNLKQVDANWTAEILKSYVGLNRDYDTLSISSKHLPHLLSNLSVDLLDHSSQEAQDSRLELDRMIREKSQLVEKFKRRNAVLRNSLRYLPTAQAEIAMLLTQEKKSSEQKEAVDQLVSSVLQYNIFPEEQLAGSIQAQNERLPYKLAGTNPEVLEKGRNLTRHVDLILNERPGVATLVMRINGIGITEKLNMLSKEINQNRAVDLDESNERGKVAAVYGSAMLILFIIIGFWTARRIVRLNEITYSAHHRLLQLEQQLVEKDNTPASKRTPKS